MPNVTISGDGSQKSIITGNKNFADGVRTSFQTASFGPRGFLFASAYLKTKEFICRTETTEYLINKSGTSVSGLKW
ncbi:hypothetical protein GBA52_022960 [Prunus armeniaca]|nr:hypothetical protein GBA52_022960 [Prunus armeniaca]